MSVATALCASQRLFQEALLLPEARDATRYLSARRGADLPGAGLGAGLPGYSEVLLARGCTQPDLLGAGVVDAEGRETMVGRITFSWLSLAGDQILGLGGRTWIGRTPKYHNTAAPWFTKGRAVFGLAQAAQAIHSSGYAVIVEGPFDALSLWALGWPNAVATVGARVTLDQVILVALLCDRVIVMLDDDEGGRRGTASLRKLLADDLLPASLSISTATLQGHKDAGSPGVTAEAVRNALSRALPVPRP